MTATDVSVREAAARAWSLIADHRAGRLPGEPGLPLGIALEMVTDSKCEREAALQALCDGASRWLRAAMPPRLHGHMPAVGPCVEFVGEPALLASAEVYRMQVVDQALGWHNLNEQQWKNRADWLAWAGDARLAIMWLTELAAECAA